MPLLPTRRAIRGLARTGALAVVVGAALTACTHPRMPDAASSPAASHADPYLWLEDVEGERALAWARARNAETLPTLERDPRFGALERELRQVLDAKDRLPVVSRIGDHLYNFWRDAANPRGVWRRTTLDSFRTAQPAWETVLDVDALAKADGMNWVWGGAACEPSQARRCIVALSRGGADAAVRREFDLGTKAFVAGGFTLPEAKSRTDWLDPDTLLVGTDGGAGTLTDSGYPRTVRRWTRGTPLTAAPLVFEGTAKDVSVGVTTQTRLVGDGRLQTDVLLHRSLDFYRSEHSRRMADGRVVRLPVSDSRELRLWNGFALHRLARAWRDPSGREWPAGALIAADLDALTDGRAVWEPVFLPTPTRALADIDGTATRLLLTVREDVVHRLEVVQRDADGRWSTSAWPLPGRSLGAISVWTMDNPARRDDPLAEAFWMTYVDPLTPPTLVLGDAARRTMVDVKSQPAYFDATGMRVEQRFATANDGVKVPYFVVWPRGAQADGRNPTLIYGYGGFDVALSPFYSASYGRAWLARGGVLVIANLRGGGEYGPAWHQAAIGPRKTVSYDDMAAIADDLVARGVTTPQRTGISGGSNGGLMTGAVMLRHPQRFGAVVSAVPLLDMKRYHKLLAGASWMAEYGDPDKPEEWAWIERYSPYQNVRAGMKLPPVLFVTSTRDDRVHPAHARKMAARMLEQGHRVAYYENIEGGHGGAADNAQRARLQAIEFTFLWQQLGGR